MSGPTSECRPSSSPDNVIRCQQLTRDFRDENFVRAWKQDVLQLYNVLWCVHHEKSPFPPLTAPGLLGFRAVKPGSGGGSMRRSSAKPKKLVRSVSRPCRTAITYRSLARHLDMASLRPLARSEMRLTILDPAVLRPWPHLQPTHPRQDRTHSRDRRHHLPPSTAIQGTTSQ